MSRKWRPTRGAAGDFTAEQVAMSDVDDSNRENDATERWADACGILGSWTRLQTSRSPVGPWTTGLKVTANVTL